LLAPNAERFISSASVSLTVMDGTAVGVSSGELAETADYSLACRHEAIYCPYQTCVFRCVHLADSATKTKRFTLLL
jgi:hypothetical protein